MKLYRVNDLVKLAGVTARTLHHYDRIELLQPAHRSEAGYRQYGEKELLKLQQILFYRELDFPLTEIKALLDNPDFDAITTLEQHKTALQARKRRISVLIKTIDNTINSLTLKQKEMKPEELYEGLPKEFGNELRAEAIEKFGEAKIHMSEQALSKLGKDRFTRLKEKWESVWAQLRVHKSDPPESEEVQALIDQHHDLIIAFWGTKENSNENVEAYVGLSELYTQDERFTANNGVPDPDFARFLSAAMRHYVENRLSEH